ncbi:OmpA family protein [Entomobacter blattae]|uniref:Outer membrane protein n=1 Tax=Entomobacter blattae TaxID=2762277 RepID=A0A7H1NUP5_9PROT|nr:OmpA family protein [Entomobacter blattae]QNT79505.1 Outer membrane protein [Entomobacter blattae]
MKLRFGLPCGSLLSAPLALGALLISDPSIAQPVESLYIAGSGGASFNQDQRVRISPHFPSGRDRYDTGVTGLGSIGYGLGNGFRVEVEGDYRNNNLHKFVTSQFPASAGGRRQTYGIMANAFFDMDIGQNWMYPYFGAGIGYGWSALRGHVTAPNPQQFHQQFGGTVGNFAYQGMFGLSFPIPWVVGLSATTEYRFWTMLGPLGHSATSTGTEGPGYSRGYQVAQGNRDNSTYFNHSLMLGLRYEFNPAPPPPPPLPDMPPPPAPAHSRSYLVFFDWDKAVLTPRARQIVVEAAKASSYVQNTRIEVNGYTDNSAAHPGERGKTYNMQLSRRRAQAVKIELIKNGVPASTIEVRGYGDTHPLVQTGPNTREAQNRRVEILFR